MLKDLGYAVAYNKELLIHISGMELNGILAGKTTQAH